MVIAFTENIMLRFS